MSEEKKPKNMYLRIDSEVHAQVKESAEQESRSLNQHAEHIFKTYHDVEMLRARLAALEAQR